MNRMEAILACNALSRECDKHEYCKDCPVRLENNQDYDCLMDYIVENSWDRKMFTSLANDEISKALTEEKCKNEQESFATIESWEKATDKHKDNQTPSVPLENVGSIIIKKNEHTSKLIDEAIREHRENVKNRFESGLVAKEIVIPKGVERSVLPSSVVKNDDVDPPKKIDTSWLNDSVKHPYHYLRGGMECIDVIKAAVRYLKPFEAYCVGNIIKYVWRYSEKNGSEDLRKAKQYLEWLIEEVEKREQQ